MMGFYWGCPGKEERAETRSEGMHGSEQESLEERTPSQSRPQDQADTNLQLRVG